MGTGYGFKNRIRKYSDPDTGREVWKLSPEGALSYLSYFYHKSISRDNDFIIFGAEFDGVRNLFRMSIKDEEVIQLTDRKNIIPYQASMTEDDKFLLYATADSIIKLDIENIKEEVIYDIPKGWWANKTFGVTPDGSHIVQVQMDMKDYIPRNKPVTMEEQWAVKPLCRIVIIDTVTGEARIVHEEKLWLAHPQLRPKYKDTIMYCHEGPGHLLDSRIWFMDIDGKNIRCPKYRKENETFTHEYWFHDGSAIGYVNNITTEGNRDSSIRMLDIKSLKETEIMKCTSYSHCVTNDSDTMIAGDGKDPKNPYVFLADMRKGIEHRICRHDTSWKPYFHHGIQEWSKQDAHPHPKFSPDGCKVLFNTDKDGLPGVYMTDISDLI